MNDADPQRHDEADPQRHDEADPQRLDADLLGSMFADDRETSRRSFMNTTAIAGGTAAALSLSDLGTDVAAAGATDVAADEAAHDRATVEFGNQLTDGRSVVVDSVTLSLGGYVVVHDKTLLEGDAVGSVIGVSEPLGEGTHEDVPVGLFDVRGAEFDDPGLDRTQPLIAMAHFDANDNGQFDFVTSGGEKDGPYLRSDQPVVDVGYAVLEPTLVFRNQDSDGTAVTVAEATLPSGGFVAVHDASLFEGDVLGSVVGVSGPLEPWRREDVTVELFTGVPGASFDRTSLSGTEPLIAMPHLDTNRNGRFEFVASNANQDRPYVVDGQLFVDLAFVTAG